MKRLTALLVTLLLLRTGNVEAAELREIRQRGYLIVAVKDNLPPLGFRAPTGQLRGLEIELAHYLARALLGRDAVVLKPVSNSERLEVVQTGEVDLTIARVTATAARFRVVNFSTPYYFDGTGLITKAAGIQNLSDLADQKVAILAGSSTIAGLRFILPSARLVGVQSYQEAQSLLAAGTVKAFAADASILSYWAQQVPQYHVLPSRLSAEPLSVALPRGLQYDPLRREVNQAIAQSKATGWLPARIRYWGLPNERPIRAKPTQFDRLEEKQ